MLAVILAISSYALIAQVGGERGIAPVASSTDIDVSGIEVNVRADSAEEARQIGWQRAQRTAWRRLNGPDIPDSQLEGLVSAIVVEEEAFGPRRYIARLGVIFDRQRAGGLLGGVGTGRRSAPMLTLPVMSTAGTNTMFEYRNVWQRAWAEYQFGSSPIDYVRPTGAGGDSLLLTAGQTSRRSRVWWNVVLNQYSAADVITPVARLEYQWPGGPVIGRFTARYGPDNRYLEEFTLRAQSSDDLPEMLARAVGQMDEIYTQALSRGTISPDPSLTLDMVEISPEIRALIEEAQRAEAAEMGLELDPNLELELAPTTPVDAPPPPSVIANRVMVQAVTPDPRSFDSALQGLRGIAGVQGVAVTSTAIGGTSVIQVTYIGSAAELAAQLQSSGWAVSQNGNTLAISR